MLMTREAKGIIIRRAVIFSQKYEKKEQPKDLWREGIRRF
jgi:hypothetical protein